VSGSERYVGDDDEYEEVEGSVSSDYRPYPSASPGWSDHFQCSDGLYGADDRTTAVKPRYLSQDTGVTPGPPLLVCPPPDFESLPTQSRPLAVDPWGQGELSSVTQSHTASRPPPDDRVNPAVQIALDGRPVHRPSTLQRPPPSS
jgi:hypothetical protein